MTRLHRCCARKLPGAPGAGRRYWTKPRRELCHRRQARRRHRSSCGTGVILREKTKLLRGKWWTEDSTTTRRTRARTNVWSALHSEATATPGRTWPPLLPSTADVLILKRRPSVLVVQTPWAAYPLQGQPARQFLQRH